MRAQWLLGTVGLVVQLGALQAGASVQPEAGLRLAGLAGLPLRFEENRGQADARVRFLARGAGFGLFLTADEVVASLRARPADGRPERAAVVRLGFGPQARPATLVGEQALPSLSHHLNGNDPARWTRDVPNFGRVRLAGVYPGIDLVFYGREGRLEYDLIVAPGGDPGAIRLDFAGASRVRLDAHGDLVLETPSGDLVQRAPVVFSEGPGGRRALQGRYVRRGPHAFGFQVSAYDRDARLVIDPVLQYSTFLGGGLQDIAFAVAVDPAGAAYLAGYTVSTNFPAHGGIQGDAPDVDAFVSKLSPDGSRLVWSTYLGGNGEDAARGLAVDGSGSAYVVGGTGSSDFPTVNAYQTDPDGFGIPDGFVTRLAPTGNALVYSTYLGGPGGDDISAIALGPLGEATVTGTTATRDFPITAGAFQTRFGGQFDAFVTRLAAAGNALVYSTFLGSSEVEQGRDVVLDAAGDAIVVGYTYSASFPTLPPTSPLGGADAFLVTLNGSGSALLSSTRFGGSRNDEAKAVALDPTGNVYVAGYTESPDFPVVGGAQGTHGGLEDGFVRKTDPAGATVLYSSFLGGSQADRAQGLAVDAQGEAVVVGRTASADFPVAGALQASYGGGTNDAFVSRLAANGASLRFSTFLGGSGYDESIDVALDAGGNPFLVGFTDSLNFPIRNAYQPGKSGGADAFLAKLTNPPAGADLAVAIEDPPAPVLPSAAYSVRVVVTNYGSWSAATPSLTVTLDPNLVLSGWSGGGFACSQVGVTLTCTHAPMPAAQVAALQLDLLAPPFARRYPLRAVVASTTFDPVPANNMDTETASVFFVKGDLDFDQQTDLVLCNTLIPQCALWFMDGVARVGAQAPISPAPASLDWVLAGVDDFNADGQNDLLYWNRVTGVLEFWIMDGTGLTRLGLQPISGAPTLAANWVPVATADFDNDGRPDILWRNTTSQKLVVWLLNGTTKVGNLIPQPDQAVDANWEVVGAPDIDQDGHVDLAWYNTSSGRIVLWFLDKDARRTYGRLAFPPSAGSNAWKVLATGDFGVGPAGQPATQDLLWRNQASGRFVVWYLDTEGNRTAGVFTSPDSPSPNPLDWTVSGPR